MFDVPVVTLAAVFTATGLATWLATWLVLRELRRRAILDKPNRRSSHRVPTPRGAGLAVVPVVLVAWAIIASRDESLTGLGAVLPAAMLLALVSWLDDLRGLTAAIRLLVQIAAVAAGLAVLPPESLIFNGFLPVLMDRVLAALIWLWFVNLFNFMDGIDGITGIELASIGTGLAVLGMMAGVPEARGLLAVVLVGASIGFLAWNWSPARIFLGDVGSVPLGYLSGWLLLQTALAGYWWAAAILPLYYLTDATATLLRRLARGEKIWEAHREHYYQRAVQGGLSHRQVSLRIIATNLVLITAAAMTPKIGAWATLPAMGAVVVLIAELRRHRRSDPV